MHFWRHWRWETLQLLVSISRRSMNASATSTQSRESRDFWNSSRSVILFEFYISVFLCCFTLFCAIKYYSPLSASIYVCRRCYGNLFWLVGWLAGWLTDWLTDWLIELTMIRMFCWLMQLLQTMLPSDTTESPSQGASAENLQKNRFPHILPGLWHLSLPIMWLDKFVVPGSIVLLGNAEGL